MKIRRNERSGTRACICCNGELNDVDRARLLASGADLLIAADGGARYIAAMGLKPHVIIGDMDSIKEDLFPDDEDIQRITFPRDKNRSDTELAVEWAVEQGAVSILLLGGWGARPDHTLGNAALLLKFPGILKLWDDGYLIMALTSGQQRAVHSPVGAVVSMFPFAPESGVKTTGLKYDLDDENLKYPTHGLSNTTVSDNCLIAVTRGLIILCAQGGQIWPEL